MVKNTSVSFSQGTTHSTLWTWLTSNRLLLSSLWRKDWLKGPGPTFPNWFAKCWEKWHSTHKLFLSVNTTRNKSSRSYNIAPGLCNTELPAGLKFWDDKRKHETSVTWGCVLLHIVLKRVTKFQPWWCWEAAHEAGTQSDTVCLGWCRSSPWHLLAWEEWTSSVDGRRQTAGWRVADEGHARQQRRASCYISWCVYFSNAPLNTYITEPITCGHPDIHSWRCGCDSMSTFLLL